MASVLLALPLAMSAGGFGEAPTSLRRVQTSKLIDAAPEAIWPLLYNLPDLPESRFWMFRSGVAHPTAIRMAGNTRYCLLTTGPMPERIIRADKNQCLEFEVLATPPTMKEVNPFVHASPKHLTGYFSCVRGRFDLERLPDGRTRVTGTSWYRCRFAPAWYWNLWTDTIVRHVHLEVLDAMAARVGRGRQE
jgi:hypothetical protein